MGSVCCTETPAQQINRHDTLAADETNGTPPAPRPADVKPTPSKIPDAAVSLAPAPQAVAPVETEPVPALPKTEPEKPKVAPSIEQAPAVAEVPGPLSPNSRVPGAGSSNRWKITAPRGPHARFGISVEEHACADRPYLTVKVIAADQAIAAWNTANAARAIQVGDHVYEVNGARGAKEMLQNMADPGDCLKMTLARPWTIKIPSNKSKLGVDLTAYGTERHLPYLTVQSIKPGGVVDRWNQANPALAIAGGDRVWSLNGRLEPLDMLESVKVGHDVTELTLERPDIHVLTVAPNGQGLGCDLATHNHEEVYVTVHAINPGGTVASWNAANPGQAIEVGDRILGVNCAEHGINSSGERVLAELARIKETKESAKLVVERP